MISNSSHILSDSDVIRSFDSQFLRRGKSSSTTTVLQVAEFKYFTYSERLLIPKIPRSPHLHLMQSTGGIMQCSFRV